MFQSQDPSSSPSSFTLGHYTIGRTIGKGTFGKVKLGAHSLTGEKVAVKILEKDKIKDSSDVERVSREIKILKLVKHPNVIGLYEIIETQKQLYLIMEYACGGELFDYIVARSRLKEQQACLFFQQLLSGIEYLQRVGVVHRDLKPENLLLDENKNLKIVDFGLSNLYRAEETLKTACGSPCYAAPEMIAGKRYHGSRVDVWSCGVVLFAMLCGYLPFEDPNTSLLYKKILGGEYKCAPWVSPEAQDLMRRILNTNPDHRYTVEQIRAHGWYLKNCNKNFNSLPFGEVLKIDENVLKKVELLGLNAEVTKESLQKNKHNKFTSTYLLLLKKEKNDEISQSFSNKVAQPQPPSNPRGDSHSINPRIKKLFEFREAEREKEKEKEKKEEKKVEDKKEEPSSPSGYQIRVREVNVAKQPRRKVYYTTTDRNRAASTGYPGSRPHMVPMAPMSQMVPVAPASVIHPPHHFSPIAPIAPPHYPTDGQKSKYSNRRNFRPVHVRTPVSYADANSTNLNLSIRNSSPRAGTALDVSMRRSELKYFTLK